MRTARPVRALAAMVAIATALATGGLEGRVAGADPWADSVIEFSAGANGVPGFGDPLSTLGPPERFTGEGIEPAVVTPFVSAFGMDEVVSIGHGGWITVAFDEPVTDDPDNPFGIDLLVFGNSFFTDAFNMSGIVLTLVTDGGVIEVSVDGIHWVTVPDVDADGRFPTAGYTDVEPYATVPGEIESDFTRPVDPAIDVSDLTGFTHEELLQVYDGSGGGSGVDLATVGLEAISYVRISNPALEYDGIEIDAIADVAPVVAGDLTHDGLVGFDDLSTLLGAWGECPTPDPFPCRADLNDDEIVGFSDLATLLGTWSF